MYVHFIMMILALYNRDCVKYTMKNSALLAHFSLLKSVLTTLGTTKLVMQLTTSHSVYRDSTHNCDICMFYLKIS